MFELESTQAGCIVVPKSICKAVVIGSLALGIVVGSVSTSTSTGQASTLNLRKSSRVSEQLFRVSVDMHSLSIDCQESR